MAIPEKISQIDKLFETAMDNLPVNGRHPSVIMRNLEILMNKHNDLGIDYNPVDIGQAYKRWAYKNRNINSPYVMLSETGEGIKDMPNIGDNFVNDHGELYIFEKTQLDEFGQNIYQFRSPTGTVERVLGDKLPNTFKQIDKKFDLDELKAYHDDMYELYTHKQIYESMDADAKAAYFEENVKPILDKIENNSASFVERDIQGKETINWAHSINEELIQKGVENTTTKTVKNTMDDTVEETLENTTENVLEETVEAAGETIAKEVIEEGTEKVIKEITGINVELDGLNKKRTPKKLKKGTGKYKGKTKELYDRLDNSRYWAVDFPGSNGDFAVHGPNGTKRLEKESIDQQRRKRKYEQTRKKYERKQQQNNQQKQKEFVDSTMHVDDEIDLDEINKKWYESKQREFDQRQKEIDDYFENNADIDPEDVLKDDYEPDANKFNDDIETLDKNFEQGKDFDINKGVNEALDAADNAVDATRTGGSISKYLKEFSEMGFIEKAMTLGNVAGAVSEYKNARREGHGVISSVARAGVDFALGEAMGLYYPLFLLAKEAPGLIVKGSEMLYKENRKMNSAANQQVFGDAQFQDTQQLATMRQSGMEMAKMAQYNLQQTLMGNEATYFHR